MTHTRPTQGLSPILHRLTDADRPGSLVVFPDFGGNTIYARSLVSSLASTLSCYALRLPADLITEPDAQSLEVVAGRFAEEILSHGLHPPLQLLGFSFAGALAYETGRQLDLRGARPDMVWILDLPLRKPLGLREFLKHPVHHAKAIRRHLRLNWRRLILRKQDPSVLSAYGIWRIDLSRHPESYRTVMRFLYEAFRLYRPAPSSAPATVLRASGSHYRDWLGDSLGWSDMVRGPVTVHTVPGDHLSMLNDPENASVIARRIAHSVNQETHRDT
ncbi:thioesterase domain-containing protein [Palleronia sp. KMU-117]|uniref:thioesterase domain-containing protein n=1 Tax=Palleronia sp. KMU-117 TaxID=3434108 RepID=UPI003D7197A8